MYQTTSASRQDCISFEGSAWNAWYIYGYLGLAFTEYVNITDDFLSCYGEASCFDISQINIRKVNCIDVSCANNIMISLNTSSNSNLNKITHMLAHGMFSSKNSVHNDQIIFLTVVIIMDITWY